MIENKITRFLLDEVIVERDTRQRRKIPEDGVQELASSIHQRGLIHTILVERGTNKLIAGERRLLAFKVLRAKHGPGYDTIPGRYAKDVSEDEVLALELEENIKREQLDWKDQSLAILRYHDLKAHTDEGWTLTRTSELLNLSSAAVSKYIAVGREIQAGNELVINSIGVSAAYNILSRSQDRAIATELDKMLEVDREPIEPDDPPEPEAKAAILAQDFIPWAEAYGGKKFNFIHCDFPYGIGWDEAQKFNSSAKTKDPAAQYADDEKTYLDLIDALVSSWPRLMHRSSHMMFWLSGAHGIQHMTRRRLEGISGIWIDDFVLMWHKSDGAGALPMPDKSGRRTYEVALHATIDNRKVVRAVAMSYAAPTGRATRLHISEKPEPVLRHFFRMYVDETTRMLDPTCGSGSSVRAAEALGAEAALGLEIKPDLATEAQDELLRARRLRHLSQGAA